MSRSPRLIAGGPFSPRTAACVAAGRRLLAQARRRHGAAPRGASLLARLRLELAIRREVRAELARLFPPHALYAAGPRRGR